MAAELETFLFTSESVNEGHPDKICDQAWHSTHDSHGQGTGHGFVLCTSWRPSKLYTITNLTSQVSDAVLDACLAQDPNSKVRRRRPV